MVNARGCSFFRDDHEVMRPYECEQIEVKDVNIAGGAIVIVGANVQIKYGYDFERHEEIDYRIAFLASRVTAIRIGLTLIWRAIRSLRFLWI